LATESQFSVAKDFGYQEQRTYGYIHQTLTASIFLKTKGESGGEKCDLQAVDPNTSKRKYWKEQQTSRKLLWRIKRPTNIDSRE
jgi:hypothetical protein